MRRRSVLTLAVAVVALAAVPAAAPQSVDDLVARNLRAKGGLEKMQAVQSLKQTSRITLPGGFEATLVVYGRRPNLTRQEMTLAGQTIVSAFDGTTAWAINPLRGMTTPSALSGEEAAAIREQSDFDGPLVDYKAKGYTIELVGTETLGDRRVHHLKITSRTGAVQRCYLDAETALEARIVSETPMGAIEQHLSDYRDVDGLQLPFSVRSLMGGIETARIAVERIEINARFDDAIFRMARAPSARPR